MSYEFKVNEATVRVESGDLKAKHTHRLGAGRWCQRDQGSLGPTLGFPRDGPGAAVWGLLIQGTLFMTFLRDGDWLEACPECHPQHGTP